MGKHARKRQRRDKPAQTVAPLGTAALLDDDADKDDEERRLESILFGKPLVPGRGAKVTAAIDEDQAEEDDGADVTAAELEGMLDSDVSYHLALPFIAPHAPPSKLFFVDDGTTTKTTGTIGNDLDVSPPEDSSEDSSDPSSSGDEEQSEGSSTHDSPRDEAEAPTHPPPTPHNPKTRKPPAWTDPDDATLEVSLASSARLRKLRDAPQEDAVKGPEYERRLRRQFVKMNPTPEWATAARRKRRRKEGSDADAAADANAEVSTPDLDTLLASSGGILGRKSRALLNPGVLAIERLRDANQAAQAEGEVTTLQFHPSPQVSMLLVASSDRRIRLFNVRDFLPLFISFNCHHTGPNTPKIK